MLESASAIAGSKEIGKDDRLMDSNDQEKERGITILAKNAALTYNGVKVNIVDHGKTTLVDAMLESASAIAGSKEIGKDDRLMDSNDQEKERGITILAKNAALTYNG